MLHGVLDQVNLLGNLGLLLLVFASMHGHAVGIGKNTQDVNNGHNDDDDSVLNNCPAIPGVDAALIPGVNFEEGVVGNLP